MSQRCVVVVLVVVGGSGWVYEEAAEASAFVIQPRKGNIVNIDLGLDSSIEK